MILSIIIPIYNVEDYIENCLLSVFKQKELDDVEIILVNDCGTDNSMNLVYKLVENWSTKCSIRIIDHIKNQGLSAARNTGVKYANGEYLFFLDSDDELPDNTISAFTGYINKYKDVDFFIGNYKVIGNFQNSRLDTTVEIYEENMSIYKSYTEGKWYPMAWGKFIKRSFFIDKNLWFPERRLHEDLLFSFKLALSANKLCVVNSDVYIYRIREASITTRKSRKNFIDIFWIISQQIKLINNKYGEISRYSYNYISALSCNLVITICISKLKYVEKIIILNWVRKTLKSIKKNYTLRSFVKTSIVYTPHLILDYLLHIVKKK